MIESIITYIDSFLDFEEEKGLAELQRRGEIVFPGVYCKTGEYDQIDFDQYNSLSYHRLSKETARKRAAAFGCEDAITETYTIKLIIYCSKECEDDDRYSAVDKIQDISNNIDGIDLNTLRQQNKLLDLEISTGKTEVDSFEVWGEEFKGVDYKVPSTHILASIEYTITLVGTPACLSASTSTLNVSIIDQDDTVIATVEPGGQFLVTTITAINTTGEPYETVNIPCQ